MTLAGFVHVYLETALSSNHLSNDEPQLLRNLEASFRRQTFTLATSYTCLTNLCTPSLIQDRPPLDHPCIVADLLLEVSGRVRIRTVYQPDKT
jgi:hypothetical protein